jgi:hypothetical protein
LDGYADVISLLAYGIIHQPVCKMITVSKQ